MMLYYFVISYYYIFTQNSVDELKLIENAIIVFAL